MGKGYLGKILMVDLGSGKIEEEIVPDEVYEKFGSGAGLAAKLLYDRIPAGADPLGPDNILGLVSGLLTGTNAFFSGRWMAVGKSPLTGGWGEANAGGKFSPAIKRAGYDGIFFRGISETPVYLKVIDGKAELVDASHLWGRDIADAEAAIKEEAEAKVEVALIGPAGEKKSLISGIATDKGRIAARSGLGSVMGSKNLKAVAAGGTQRVEADNPDKIKELNKTFSKWLNSGKGMAGMFRNSVLNFMARYTRVSPVAMAMSGDAVKLLLGTHGTIVTNVLSSENGDSPVMNWKGSGVKNFPISTHADKLNPFRINKYKVKKYHCYSCPLGCGGVLEVNEPGCQLGETHRPEYETVCSFGALLLNNDLNSILKINEILNRAGMDSISAGSTIAWAMECYENGVLSREELDDIDLTWGNSAAILEIIDKMIRRDGIGDTLADGCKKASEKLGKGSEFAMHAGGQEMPMHDSRFDPGMGVAYELEPTPGRHTNHGYQWIDYFALHRLFRDLPKPPGLYMVKSKYNPDNKWLLSVAASKYIQFANAMGACLFGVQMGGNLRLPEYCNAATGWNHPNEHYLSMGERVQNLRQAFNIKQGIKPLEDFKMPTRAWGDPPLSSGPMKGITVDAAKFRQDYLEGMGWNPETAVPTKEKLEELDLGTVAKDIYK
jgi:aldehyde:ferredoxin oxidoreductase